MITVNGHRLNATVFPDKTSQVWKLPEWLLKHSSYWIDWRWESESEIIQLMQLSHLLCNVNPVGANHITLYVPYLPYARQDKKIGNSETFALSTMGYFLNAMAFEKVITLDVHNEDQASNSIRHFQNIHPVEFHEFLINLIKPDRIIFPDRGAFKRYSHLEQYKHLIFSKVRDQGTGKITSHVLEYGELTSFQQPTMLVIDDICDGGATFLSVAEAIYRNQPHAKLVLGVTHGIFSKGLEDLSKNFADIRCTNSLHTMVNAYEV